MQLRRFRLARALVSALSLIALVYSTALTQSGRPPDPQQERQRRAATESNENKKDPTAGEPRKGSLETPRGQPVSEDEVVRVSTDLTNVLMTAVDKDKRFVTTLRQGDIRILENGVPQEINTFERETDLPLSLALLIDVSKSEEFTLPNEKSAAREFVNSVLRPGKDMAAVVSFTGDATVEQELTDGRLKLEQAINRVEIVYPVEETTIISASGFPVSVGTDSRLGTTAIWDAVSATSNDMLSQTQERTRRAIILLTDGQDTSSRIKRQDAIDRAVKDNVVIYSIGIGDRHNYGLDEGALRKISEKTGGRAFFPDNEMELRAAFAQIQDELRSQYLVAYSSTNKVRDGSFRKIQVEVTNPDLKKQKLRLLYRDGYFARDKSSTASSSPRGAGARP
jgi:VWFA-related protein